MSPVELLAALTGLIAIWLVVQRSVWNYPFGLVSVALYVEVFFRAKLYSDTLLQIYFFVLQLYGWWNWLHHRDEGGRATVETLTPRGQLWTGLGVLTVTLVLGFVMSRYTDAALPWWDAAIAGLSVVAQILMSRRKIEQWPLWIVTNILGIGVYLTKNLYPTVLLYAVLLVFAGLGWRAWSRIRTAADAADLSRLPR